MSKEELLAHLKEHLTVQIFDPYSWTCDRSTTLKVQILFDEEIICSDYIEIRECTGHNE